MNKEIGLFQKYKVERIDGKPVGFVFILEPSKDPLALETLEFYAYMAMENGYENLASDLYGLVRAIREQQKGE